MKSRLLAACLALLTSSCGLLPSADGWPTIFPDWESEPVTAFPWSDSSSSPEVVIGDPPPSRFDPDVPAFEMGYGTDDEAENTGPGDGTEGAGEAAAEAVIAAPDPGRSASEIDGASDRASASSGDAADSSIDGDAIARNGEPLRSALVLDAPLEGGLTLHDLYVHPETGVVHVAIVRDADESKRAVSPAALDWTSAAGPRLAAPIATRDARALFAAEDVVEIIGVVSSLTDSGAEASLLVRDEGNLLHRVAVPASDVLERAFPPLEVGAGVVVRAAPSRDDGGKVWVPTQVQVGDASLKLRDEEGRADDTDLIRGLLSARGLIGRPIRMTDGEAIGADWTLSPDGKRLDVLELGGEGHRVHVPWVELPADWFR